LVYVRKELTRTSYVYKPIGRLYIDLVSEWIFHGLGALALTITSVKMVF